VHIGLKINRIIALILAAMMFTTSIGFAVDMHYCKGELKSFSFFGKAKSCHEQKVVKPCPHHAKMQLQQEESNCCDNETVYVQADIEKNISSAELVDLQQFVTIFVQVFCLETTFSQQIFTSEYYKPPLIARDLPVLVQSFLL